MPRSLALLPNSQTTEMLISETAETVERCENMPNSFVPKTPIPINCVNNRNKQMETDSPAIKKELWNINS